MTELTEIIVAEREDYWRVVVECLCEFYGMSREESDSVVAGERAAIKNHSEERLELYYHADPLSIANDLSRSSPIFPEKWSNRYLEIRDGTIPSSKQSPVCETVRMGIAG